MKLGLSEWLSYVGTPYFYYYAGISTNQGRSSHEVNAMAFEIDRLC